jgi:hypothetical protein
MTPSEAAKGVARGSAPAAGQYAPALPLSGQMRIVCRVKHGAGPQQSQGLSSGPRHPSAGRHSRRVLVSAARTILDSPRTMVAIISCRARLARSVSGGAAWPSVLGWGARRRLKGRVLLTSTRLLLQLLERVILAIETQKPIAPINLEQWTWPLRRAELSRAAGI